MNARFLFRRANRFTHTPTQLLLWPCCGLLCAGDPLKAADSYSTWVGGGTDHNWDTSANWNPAGIPLSRDLAVFSNSGGGFNPVVNTPAAIGAIKYNPDAGAFAIGGNAELTLYADVSSPFVGVQVGIQLEPGSASQVISAPLRLNDMQTWDIKASTLTVSSAISGDFSLTKKGAGTLALSGASSYSEMFVSAGTVLVGAHARANENGPLGYGSSAVTLASSSASLLTGGAFQIGRPVNLTGPSATLGGNTADASSFTGNINLGDTSGRIMNLTAAAGGNVTVSGLISGSGGVNKVGEGTVTLNKMESYTGGTTLSAGRLKLGANYAVPSSGTFTFAGGTLEGNDRTDWFGPLSLSKNSTFELSNDSVRGVFTFGDGSLSGAGAKLTINGWSGVAGPDGGAYATGDQIILGAGTSPDLLNAISFAGYGPGAIQLASGEIVPLSAVPEPTHVALAAFGSLFAAVAAGRRICVWLSGQSSAP